MKQNCLKPLHFCTSCKGLGHLEKFCRNEKDNKEKVNYHGKNNHNTKGKSTYTKGTNDKGNTKSTDSKMNSTKKSAHNNKSQRRNYELQKAKAYVAELEAADDDEVENAIDAEEDENTEEADDFYALAEVIENVESNDSHDVENVLLSSSDEKLLGKERFIIDSGCKGAHICTDVRMLLNPTSHNKVSVRGITGHSLETTHSGSMAVNGKTYCVPHADANLLSLKLLVKGGGRFDGDFHSMNVYNSDGDVILVGRDLGDGYWSCTYSDICDNEAKAFPVQIEPTRVKHFTPEERSRAKEAFDLCRKFGHPNDVYIMNSLDNGCYNHFHLTSQDLRNARVLYGPCLACAEGKIKDHSTPSFSNTQPAEHIGNHLHCDLIPLSEKSIGGNTCILFAVDEKSSYVTGVSIPSKSKLALIDGFKTIIATFNAHGHKVIKITTDDEKNFNSTKDELAIYGIKLTTTPADFHEKRAERYIQTLKSRIRATLAQLPYKLPKYLYAEAYLAGMHNMNITCNKVSSTVTPYQLVTHTKPFIPKYSFGQTGVFHHVRSDAKDNHGEWGIFLNYGSSSNYIRTYIPHRNLVYSRRTFEPHDTYPPEWKFESRMTLKHPNITIPNPPTSNDSLSLVPSLPQNSLQNQEGESFVNRNTQTGVNRNVQTGERIVPNLKNQEGEAVTIDTSENSQIDNTEILDSTNNTTTENISVPNIEFSSTTTSPPKPTTELRKTPVKTSPVVPRTSPTPLKHIDPINKPMQTSSTTSKQHSTKELINEPAISQRPKRSVRNHDWKDGPVKLRNFDDPAVNTLSVLMAKSVCKIQQAFRMSLQKALKQTDRIDSVLEAIEGEIDNMEKGNVMPPIHYNQIPAQSRDEIIDLHMFLKDKYKSNGEYDKAKARLVANGSQQNVADVGDTTSPTVNPITVMVLLNYAASQKEIKISAYDFKHAFLIPHVQPGKKIYVRIRKDLVQKWIDKYPYRSKYVTQAGNMYGMLSHYLYGLQEASKEFNELLSKYLISLGFSQSKADPCLYTHHHPKHGIMHAAIHVDDILLIAPNKTQQSWFESSMKKQFEIVSQYDNVSYLGMSISRDEATGNIRVVHDGYVKDILKKYNCDKLSKYPQTPATATLYQHDDNSPACDKNKYLSLTMTLMYLARFTRPDILMPVSYLATRSSTPTDEDFSKLMRIVRYLAGTKDIGIVYKASKMVPIVYADASHNMYSDGRGQAGMVITFGSGPIFCRSFKIKCTTRSSSESELYALEDASTYVIWLRCLLSGMHINIDAPTIVFQDNQSTIIMAIQGGNFKRTKHLICKDSFVKERLLNGEMVLKYLPTKLMPADMLTKPLPSAQLNQHMKQLCIVH